MNNIVIIGGGIAGYTAALKLASKDNAVILVEKDAVGGTCLNKGCIPTKLLYHLVQSGNNFRLIQKTKDQTIQNLRLVLTYLISAKKITYINSDARLLENNRIFMTRTSQEIEYDTLVLAIGSKPIVPKLLEQADILTSDEILSLEEAPARLLIIGAGYIGIEIAHIFNMLNTKVTIVEQMDSILPAISQSASDVVASAMAKKGITIYTNTKLQECSYNKAILSNGNEIEFDKILLSLGRQARSIESLIPIEYEKNFIKTDDCFQTSRPGIYAIGDCTSGPSLAHKAEYDARILSGNILHNRKDKKNYTGLPSCVFSEPPLASIGILQGSRRVRVEFSSIGKSYCDSSTEGFLELYLDKAERICGGLVVNNNAQEILAALTPIVYSKMTCEQVSNFVWSHPSSSEIIKEAVQKVLR